MHGRRVDLVVPQPRFGAPAQQRDAGPGGIIRYERRIAAERGLRFRVAKDEPFRELLRGRIDEFLFGIGGVAGFAMALQVEHVLHDRRIAGELRFGGLVVCGSLLVALRREAHGRFGLLRFRRRRHLGLRHGLAHGLRRACDFRLPGGLNLLVGRRCERVARASGKCGDDEQTRPWSEHVAHSVIPSEPTGTNRKIRRSVRLELTTGYHSIDSQLSRFGNRKCKSGSGGGT